MPKTPDSAPRFAQAVAPLGLHALPYAGFHVAVETPSAPGALPDWILDIYAGTAQRHLGVEDLSPDATWEQAHESVSHRTQTYHLYRVSDHSVELQSDRLSFKPLYIAANVAGVWVATRLHDLFKLDPGLMRPLDRHALAELVVYGAPTGTATLHAKVRRLLPGAVLRWTPHKGIAITRSRAFKLGPIQTDIATQSLLDSCHQASLDQMQGLGKGLSEPVYAAFSGGFDSRYGVAVAKDVGMDVKSYVFGRAYHDEVKVAHRAGKALGILPEILPYQTDHILDSVQRHATLTEGQVDLIASLSANLFQIPAPPGAILLHGSSGNALYGSHLDWLSPTIQDDDHLAREIALGFMHERKRMLPYLERIGIAQDSLFERVRAQLPAEGQAHQKFLLWDWEHRQRPYIAPHLQILGSHFHVISATYTDALLEQLLTLPRALLEDRRVFRLMLANKYPALARIRHSEETRPILPGLGSQLSDWWLFERRRIMEKCLGSKNYWRLAKHRHPEIWNLAFEQTEVQQERMLQTIRAAEPIVSKKFGFDEMLHWAEPGNRRALRAMYLLAAYAESLS